jgi:hypothetical protein
MSSPPPDLLGSLAQHRVWGLLSASVRQALVAQSQVLNLHTGDLVAAAGEWSAHLWLILQGRVDLKDPELAQTHTLLADESFGAGITPWNLQQSCHVSCTEDSQLLQVPKACLQDLLVSEPAITPFLPVPLDGRHPGSLHCAQPWNRHPLAGHASTTSDQAAPHHLATAGHCTGSGPHHARARCILGHAGRRGPLDGPGHRPRPAQPGGGRRVEPVALGGRHRHPESDVTGPTQSGIRGLAADGAAQHPSCTRHGRTTHRWDGDRHRPDPIRLGLGC